MNANKTEEPFETDKDVTGTWLVQSEEHAICDLGVVSSSPTLGVQII